MGKNHKRQQQRTKTRVGEALKEYSERLEQKKLENIKNEDLFDIDDKAIEDLVERKKFKAASRKHGYSNIEHEKSQGGEFRGDLIAHSVVSQKATEINTLPKRTVEKMDKLIQQGITVTKPMKITQPTDYPYYSLWDKPVDKESEEARKRRLIKILPRDSPNSDVEVKRPKTAHPELTKAEKRKEILGKDVRLPTAHGTSLPNDALSYNPKFTSHNNLLLKTAKKIAENQKKEQKFIKIKTEKLKKKEEVMNKEISDYDEGLYNTIVFGAPDAQPPIEKTTRKRLYDCCNYLEFKESQEWERIRTFTPTCKVSISIKKKVAKKLSSFRGGLAYVIRKLKQNRIADKEVVARAPTGEQKVSLPGKSPRRIGRVLLTGSFYNKGTEVPLPKNIPGNIIGTKQLGNSFAERWVNYQKRNIIDPKKKRSGAMGFAKRRAYYNI